MCVGHGAVQLQLRLNLPGRRAAAWQRPTRPPRSRVSPPSSPSRRPSPPPLPPATPPPPTCLLEGHPQRAHVHVRGHPASFELAGGADQHPCGREAAAGGQGGTDTHTHTHPPASPPPQVPLWSWFSCFRHLALRFWNQTCGERAGGGGTGTRDTGHEGGTQGCHGRVGTAVGRTRSAKKKK